MAEAAPARSSMRTEGTPGTPVSTSTMGLLKAFTSGARSASTSAYTTRASAVVWKA